MEPNPLAALDDDLWYRLLAASEICSVKMVRTAPARPSLQHCRRTWHVVLCGVRGGAHDWLGSEAPTVNDAVREALALARLSTRVGTAAPTAGSGSHTARANWARLRRYDVGFRISICRPARPAACQPCERPWRMELEDECEVLQRCAMSEHELLATAIANVLNGAERLRWLSA